MDAFEAGRIGIFCQPEAVHCMRSQSQCRHIDPLSALVSTDIQRLLEFSQSALTQTGMKAGHLKACGAPPQGIPGQHIHMIWKTDTAIWTEIFHHSNKHNSTPKMIPNDSCNPLSGNEYRNPRTLRMSYTLQECPKSTYDTACMIHKLAFKLHVDPTPHI